MAPHMTLSTEKHRHTMESTNVKGKDQYCGEEYLLAKISIMPTPVPWKNVFFGGIEAIVR